MRQETHEKGKKKKLVELAACCKTAEKSLGLLVRVDALELSRNKTAVKSGRFDVTFVLS